MSLHLRPGPRLNRKWIESILCPLCLVALGLYLLGRKTTAVYDGSWAEWGLAEDTPAVAA